MSREAKRTEFTEDELKRARAARAFYMREWRAKHREQVRAAGIRQALRMADEYEKKPTEAASNEQTTQAR